MAGTERIWVLLGRRTGDNNQLLRLAGELGVPFRTISLRYNTLANLPPRILGASLASLDSRSREEIRPPWPDLVLGIGNRSVPAALAVRQRAGDSVKLVRLGNPRLSPRNFDLVVTTAQYAVPDAPNVVRLPFGIGTAGRLEASREEAEWLDGLARPHRLLLIGGDTFMWTLSPQAVARAAAELKRKCESGGGSVIAVSSGRSRKPVLDAVEETLGHGEHGFAWGRFPRYPVLLDDSDEIYVTADSVAMISDSVATGKPLGLVLPEMTAAGRFFYALSKLGVPVPVRDVRRFWTSILDRGLAGMVAEPRSGRTAEDPLAIALGAVRALL